MCESRTRFFGLTFNNPAYSVHTVRTASLVSTEEVGGTITKEDSKVLLFLFNVG